jgi:hypothetical protein
LPHVPGDGAEGERDEDRGDPEERSHGLDFIADFRRISTNLCGIRRLERAENEGAETSVTLNARATRYTRSGLAGRRGSLFIAPGTTWSAKTAAALFHSQVRKERPEARGDE